MDKRRCIAERIGGNRRIMKYRVMGGKVGYDRDPRLLSQHRKRSAALKAARKYKRRGLHGAVWRRQKSFRTPKGSPVMKRHTRDKYWWKGVFGF